MKEQSCSVFSRACRWRRHRRVGPPKARPAFVLLLLGGALALTGALAYEAQQAARSHRTAAEAVLRDYVRFASWELARLARRDLESAISGTAASVLCAAADDPAITMPAIRATLARASSGSDCCLAFSGARGFFRLDARNDQLAVTGATRPQEARNWASTAIARASATRPADGHALFLAPSTAGRVVGALVRKESQRQDALREVVGFEADAASLRSIFDRILEREPLLPPSLTGGVVDNSMIAVRVTEASGTELYRSAKSRTSELAATGSLGEHLGDLRYRLSLRPDAAGRLVIGGLPASRLPLFMALLLLAVGLVVAAGFQLHREFELARLRSEFVSNVSHELRTPLAQIRMFTETLLLGRVRSDAERTRSLEVIAREARRLGQLVENVLRFSRTAPGGRLTCRTTSVGLLAAEVIDDFAPLAEPRRTRFEARLDNSLVAPIDPSMFRQMLLNLLDNAVKYGPLDQTVFVMVEASGDHVSLLVEDQGPGVPEEDQDRIWEPFRRARSAAAESVPGTGIGLAVVRTIAEQHGGRAWVERSPAGGARFGVELPGAQRTATADHPETSGVGGDGRGDWRASA